ncbi:hypothetical protein BL254_19875 [Protofrankia sp. BMG5.30]|uniref:Uncharacterized protein n=1 Tax=Protofrankia coriariae TaxID=1562887 RepID=A0ABR5EZ67_9ACTN|nr:hypothetical protein FrCorBMG51_22730 [Protofrankia coriariae]ONH33458.1 hypothetical protein BL254_19875 [Protofrankia sp. BMG5.30]
MQDDVIRAEYTRLRNAAIGVLDAMSDAENPSARVDVALRNLRAVLSGDTPRQSDTERGALDPFEHSLAARLYVGRQAEPIPLPQRAADLRRRLAGDRGLDERLPGELSRNVVITELRAMIVASLLKELAARLSPGAAFGPGQSGDELARLATDLAKELLDQTFVGE